MLAALFFVLGAAMSAIACFALLRAVKSRSWPSVGATIVKSEVRREDDDGVWFHFEVAYRYEVNGRHFVGSQVRTDHGVILGTPWFARRVARKYRIGAAVRVRYMPSNPSFSVLETRIGIGWLVTAMTFSFVFFANCWNQWDR